MGPPQTIYTFIDRKISKYQFCELRTTVTITIPKSQKYFSHYNPPAPE